GAVALAGGLLLGLAAVRTGWGLPPVADGGEPDNNPVDRALDLVLPAALLVLVVGLFWGLPSSGVKERLRGFADLLQLKQDKFAGILPFGLPAVLCYTFVERSVRFGLGVGAILLGAGMCGSIREAVLFQDRSFFGVLKVEEGASYLWELRNDKGEARY